MNAERGKFESEERAELEAQIDAAVDKARVDPRFAHLFEPIDRDAADAEALASIKAGRYYTNDEVIAWLKTWGQPDWKPLRRQWPE